MDKDLFANNNTQSGGVNSNPGVFYNGQNIVGTNANNIMQPMQPSNGLYFPNQTNQQQPQSLNNQLNNQQMQMPFLPPNNNFQAQHSMIQPDQASLNTDILIQKGENNMRLNDKSNPNILTNDELKYLFMRMSQLKQGGADHKNSVEYIKILEYLKAFSAYRKANQLIPSAPRDTATNRTNTPNANEAPVRPMGDNQQPGLSLNNNQIMQLSEQINTFKYISRDLPIPVNEKLYDQKTILKNLSNPLAVQNSDLIPSKIAADVINNQQNNGDSKSNNPKLSGLYYIPPQTLLKESHNRLQRVIVPSITPHGLNPYQISKEREDRIKSRIVKRIKELESFSSNLNDSSINEANPEIGNGDFSANSSNEIYSAKLKALIELKSLRLLDMQKKLRMSVVKGATEVAGLSTSIDRNSFRRMKVQTLKEARNTEKLEKLQRAEREKREKQKHNNFLSSIIQHGKDLKEWHRNLQSRQAKVGRMVASFHSQVEKEEQRRQERIQKHRLELLKTGDEAEYLKLVNKEKDTRISLLINQTEGFLKSLTNSVVAQQNDDAYYESVREVQEDSLDEDADYYAIAHRIKEEITEQPTMLVGGTLKEYQLKGLQWMVSLYNNRLNGILADEMGLGKTIQTIALITHLIEVKKQNGPYLVLVPLATVPNWELEFEKWAPKCSVVCYAGTPTKRKEIKESRIKHEDFQVMLTTFEYVIRDKSTLSKIKWGHMIIDEGHRMKNAESKLSTTLNKFYSTRYRLILTGTPLQNNLPELWSLLNFALPRVFNSVKTFDEWFNTPFANAGGQEKIELNEEEQLLIIKRLHKVLRPFLLRRLKKDVESELPDKVEKVIKCKMSTLQQKVYHRIQKREVLIVNTDKKKSLGAKGFNNTLMQLRKACNHPYVFSDVENVINPGKVDDANLYRVSGKFELLDRILPKLFETGHRVLIFFQMTTIMNIFEDYLRFRKIRSLRLDGSTKHDIRAESLKLFNAKDSEYKVFLLSTRAGGLGLNLQTADTVVIFDSDWNPHQDLQAQDRAHRIGQKKAVLILRLITANSVEEKILERAQYKLDIDGKVIQAGKFDNKSTEKEREELLRSLLGDNGPTTEPDVDDDDINDIIARNDEELETFKEMDKLREAAELEAWRKKGNRGPMPEDRMIQLDELPQSFLEESCNIVYEDESEELGRGRRVKEVVRYDDGLTEEQFCEAVDNAEDIDEIIERKERRRNKRLLKAGLENSGTNTPNSAMVDSDSVSNRQKRKPKGQVKNEINLKKGGKLAKHLTEEFINQLFQCVKVMEDLTDPEDPEIYVCDLFLKKPNKRMYPDYYQMISQPISIKEIKDKIKNYKYNTAEELQDDCVLMFDNARTYNEEGSMVYNNACLLEKEFLATYNRLFLSDRMTETSTRVVSPTDPSDNEEEGDIDLRKPAKRPFISIQDDDATSESSQTFTQKDFDSSSD